MLKNPNARIVACGTLLLLLFAAKLMHAQLLDCANPGTPEEFKVYLDDVRLKAPLMATQLRRQLDLLRTSLFDNLNAILQVAAKASLKPCGNRFPVDISEFTVQVAKLDQMRVVLEIWGALGGANGNETELGFVLVPARSIVTPVVFVANERIQMDKKGLINNIKLKLGTFVPIMLGTRLFQNQEYDEAVHFLCEGELNLQQSLKNSEKLGPSITPEQKAFAAHEKDLLLQVQTMVDVSLRKGKDAGKPQYAALTQDADGRYSCSIAR